MSPLTHFLAGWAVAEVGAVTPRERFWITMASVAPDLDGLGIVIDLANDWTGRPASEWFATQHHWLFHGLFGAAVIVAVARLCRVTRTAALFWVFASFHLHLLCDLVGSRGPMAWHLWPIDYLGPFSHSASFFWKHQWPLNGWQNMAFSIALIAFALVRAVQKGRSPVMLVNARWDGQVVDALRRRWSALRNP